MNSDIIFIGSSLTRSALPPIQPAPGYLEDGRSAAIVSIPGISEQYTTQLLAIAIDSGVQTVFLEINAYAHEYKRPLKSGEIASLSRFFSELGMKMTRAVWWLFNLGPTKSEQVKTGANKKNKTLDVSQVEKGSFYWFQLIMPSLGDDFQTQLTRAKNANTEVIFFSPPRPESLFIETGHGGLSKLNDHVVRVASTYDVPIWYSPAPWPDDHFMDIMAHANELGRRRFQRELAQWYGSRK